MEGLAEVVVGLRGLRVEGLAEVVVGLRGLRAVGLEGLRVVGLRVVVVVLELQNTHPYHPYLIYSL